MKKVVINGNKELTGTIKISGAKNSAVALVPAALLSDGIVKIDNIPNISDIEYLTKTLKFLGAKVTRDGNLMTIDSSEVKSKEIPEEVSNKLRASYYFMSALLGKYKKSVMYFPGGCKIGARPIDQTLKSFRALGASVEEEGSKFTITADELVGGHIYLDMPSVGATINAILASVKANGKTTIENAAKEPEIVNVATLLNNMGAKIRGAGTSEIKITGVETLGDAYIEVIPDRIETGTYIIAGALMGNNLRIENIIPEHIEMLVLKLKEMKVNLTEEEDSITISKTENMKGTNIKTLGYPGFATDLQQPITVLLTQAKGVSNLEETIYENRFAHIPYLVKMGADITVSQNNRKIKVNGPTPLKGKKVVATDLRAGAAMILAGLTATGKTEVLEADHILRGYENIIEKLTSVGADVTLEEEN